MTDLIEVAADGTVQVVREVDFQVVEVISAGPVGPPGLPNPPSDGGDDLGTTLLGWGNLYLTSGGDIIFGNDVTIAHSEDLLTISGGVVEFSSRPTFLGSNILAASDIGVTVQAYDPDLQSWLDVVRAAGFDTFVTTPTVANLMALLTNEAAGWTNFMVTPSSANLATLVTDETGTGALVFGTTPTFTTSMLLSSGFVMSWNAGDVTLTHAANTLTFGGASSGYAFTGGPVVPATNDAAALGTTTLMWSDLFLASGAVVNFNNGDVTVTHAANTLTFGGASSGYAFTGGPVVPATNDASALGTTSLMWSDLFLASGSVVNWNAGDVTLTHAANALTFAGATSGYTFDYAAKFGSNVGASATDLSRHIDLYGGIYGLSVTSSTLNLVTGGTDIQAVFAAAGAFFPNANDTATLGKSGTAWADLFLASGAVINFNAGDVTLTHAANELALAGGTLRLNDAQLHFYTGIDLRGRIGLPVWDASYISIQNGALAESAVNSAFNQSSGGATIVNAASGQSLFLRIGNSSVATVTSTGMDFVSGSVLTWNTSDLTLTHSLNALTLAGGSLVLPAAGLTVGASVPFSDSAGVLTLTNVDALDATTEATIEAAIDTLANLTSIQSRTVTLGGNLILGGTLTTAAAFTTSGANAITLTTTGATNVTLPTTGTLATLAGSESLSNKTLVSPIITTSPTAAGATWANLGSVTTIDINGGTIDGTTIGASSPTTGVFTTATVGNTGLVVGTSTPFSDAAGVLTLQNVDALDATTEATIEAAIDTLANLTSIQGVAFTFGSYAATILNNTSELGFKQAVNLEIGVDVQAYDADLGTWAAVVRAAGFDTFVTTPTVANLMALLTDDAAGLGTFMVTPSSANLATLVTDETGSGALVFGTTPTFTTSMLLSSGFVFNWNASDLTLTHSLNTLTLTGGSLVLDAAGLTVGASIPFSDSAGVLTLQNVDALDATTEATIEAAIDTLANLTSIQSRTVTLGGNLVLGGTLTTAAAFTTSGAFALTLTATGITNVTLPTTGTLATLAGSESLSNKTLVSPIITTSPTAAGATWANLGTVTTADINGGTVDGTVIGGASAAAGTFTTLNANGGGALTGTWSNLGTVTTIDINGGTIDGTVIGGVAAAAGTFTTLNANGGGALTGTWTNLGSVTTIDINGGTIDATVIGGASAAAGTFTTLNANGGGALTGTWSNLGTVTTIDINGGTVDGAVIGGASAAAITGTLITGNRFVPNSSTIPTNGMYLPAANTLGWGINSAAEMQLDATALSPMADGGLSLGTTALGWQNLFGNTGFVLNIEGGNWVATHTSGILTVGTGDLRVTTAGTNTASVVTVGGTQTLTAKTLTAPVISDPDFSGLVDVQQSFAFTGDITPTQITASQNDYAPAGFSTATTLRLSTDASRTITGLAGGADGRVIIIHNVGINDMVLADEDVLSVAGNRFAFPTAVTLAADQSLMVQYDSTSSRWRAVGGVGGASGPGGSGDVSAASNFGADNILIRSDGSLKGVQSTGIGVDDTTFTMYPTTDDSGSLGKATKGWSDLYLAAGGKIYLNSVEWKGGAKVAASPPSSPVDGEFWYDTDTGGLFIYFDDGTSSQWVEAAANASLNGVYVPGGTDVALADGGTGASLTDPGADRILFWDDSAGAMTWLTMGTNISISGTTLNATTGYTYGTSQATTSGTSKDFTSLPSGLKRITVMFDAVSTNGTSLVQVQLGTGGSPTTTGYVASVGTTDSTTGFPVAGALAADARNGAVVFYRSDSNTWVASGDTVVTSGAFSTAGRVALGGELDMVRITTVNGTDAFDAGLVNIIYE